ncbi:MAG: ferrous iron transport protein B, partial [Candidatus Azobacteroides sp.]|nr:ferrous iron transport protein B [Candidatus Azobacteroides sp.]
MRLSELKTGEKAVIVRVGGQGGFRKRIIEMGFIKGAVVDSILNAPLKDPIEYKVMDYYVSLRRSEAELIEIIPPEEVEKEAFLNPEFYGIFQDNDHSGKVIPAIEKTIRVALIGNPNSGKTTFFNVASGSRERVGNYSGVTVDAKEGTYRQNGYTFKLVDLPGTYSLSAYTPEELFVRKQLLEQTPDVILNIVAASNLERNLYLTTQLIDMEINMVMVLNMYDELENSGAKLDYELLGKLLNIPIIPTVAKKGKGIHEVFDAVIKIYESDYSPTENRAEKRNLLINHGPLLEPEIQKIGNLIEQNEDFKNKYSVRFLAIKLLENDQHIRKLIGTLPNAPEILKTRDKSSKEIGKILNEDIETTITDTKYGFIAGALRETYTQNTIEERSTTRIIDTFVTHKLFGYPIFIFFMWLMFQTTFSLGEYPKVWIEWLVERVGEGVSSVMPDGPLKDLLTDGIINGVGGVIVFLPNILILYFFISFMEDSGYMARAAFIMDKIMHKMGLHGKSFIPLIMGFGCNVPAVMATRTIESKNSRMVTMLINPLMSCSARLPVYLLLVGAFFPTHASLILLIIYLIGILTAVVAARIFRKYLFREEDIPFVMELPPYRMPTLKSTFRHMWNKGRQYLQKMGSVILLASIVIWFLGYYPKKIDYSNDYEKMKTEIADRYDQIINRATTDPEKMQILEEKNKEIHLVDNKEHIEHQQKSYIGRIGKFIEPAIKPLGFNWKIGIGIVSGIGAKEIIVSTLSVLYTGNDRADENNHSLEEKMKNDRDEYGNPVFTSLTAFCMMLFILFYFPCIATITA